MSMRIAPPSSHSKTFTHLSSAGAPSAPGVHDTLRSGVGPSPSPSDSSTTTQPTSTHPLESRLLAWQTTQENLKMESLRRTFGMAEPIRRGMEMKITKDGEWRPRVLNRGNGLGGGMKTSLHEDILHGREASLGWEDVFEGGEEFRGENAAGVGGVLGEVEGRVGINRAV